MKLKKEERSIIKNAAFDLIQKTTPYEYEHLIYPIILNLISDHVEGLLIHGNGNISCRVAGQTRSMFVAHMDTVGVKPEPVVYHETCELISGIGETIIGGDNRAGIITLIAMIRAGIPGFYNFFVGEEKGRKGSIAFANSYETWTKNNIDRCIAFDRKHVVSVITQQHGGKCVSDEFANALSSQLGLFKDPGGSYTDSASFMEIVPECTNISAGFFNEHTSREMWLLSYTLDDLIPKACELAWEKLPTVRVAEPIVSPYKSYSYSYKDYESRNKPKGTDIKNMATGLIRRSGSGLRCDYCHNEKPSLIGHKDYYICQECFSIFGGEFEND
jgi:hypothetical protein